jgi:hypothetical protein
MNPPHQILYRNYIMVYILWENFNDYKIISYVNFSDEPQNKSWQPKRK